MIQRVQTLWLLLATLTVFLTLQFSFYSGTVITDKNLHSFTARDNFILMVLTSALGTALLINVFLFKQRAVQLKICIIALVAEVLILFLYSREIKKFSQGSLDIWAIFHLITFIALIFAATGIYKDERLIKDSNRLR